MSSNWIIIVAIILLLAIAALYFTSSGDEQPAMPDSDQGDVQTPAEGAATTN